METDIIIVGAGASGLAAAYELSVVNKKVLVLEAKDRIGGRIYSIADSRFKKVVEAGAEFIHGDLQVTLRLLKNAGIRTHAAKGKMWEVEKGQISRTRDFIEGWDKLMKELKALKNDLPIQDFLEQHFSKEKDKELKDSVIQFVQGYDAADATKASSFALRDEWENEEGKQRRVSGGYGSLLNFLADETRKKGNDILLAKAVKTIHWEKGKVEVATDKNEIFNASAVLVTIPLGVWQAGGEEGHISFVPELIEKKAASKKMGFGAVIKIIFQFRNSFWEDATRNQFPGAGFIFSDAEIPTWWTQNPERNGMLTGWLAGPNAYHLKNVTKEQILEKAISSLAYIFGEEKKSIEQKLISSHIGNWTADPFIRGAYSYATLDTHWAKNVLSKPIEHSLFFAGEALYNGTETGTVEGALASGIEVARNIIAAQYEIK